MNIFISSLIGYLLKAGGLILLLLLSYYLSGEFFKTDYVKNKKNLALYFFTGMIICLGIAYVVSSNTTPPCLEYEYAPNRVCVEYDDSFSPLNYQDQMTEAALIFLVTFCPFWFFVYRKRKELIKNI